MNYFEAKREAIDRGGAFRLPHLPQTYVTFSKEAGRLIFHFEEKGKWYRSPWSPTFEESSSNGYVLVPTIERKDG